MPQHQSTLHGKEHNCIDVLCISTNIFTDKSDQNTHLKNTQSVDVFVSEQWEGLNMDERKDRRIQ